MCIADTDGEMSLEQSVVGVDCDVSQGGVFFFRYYGSYVGDYADVVASDYTQDCSEPAAHFARPAGSDHAVGVAVAYIPGVRAIVAMNLYDPFRRDEAEHIITVNRVAAFCKAVIYAFDVVAYYEHIVTVPFLACPMFIGGLLQAEFLGRYTL